MAQRMRATPPHCAVRPRSCMLYIYIYRYYPPIRDPATPHEKEKDQQLSDLEVPPSPIKEGPSRVHACAQGLEGFVA